jgi:CBS domain-containing protein
MDSSTLNIPKELISGTQSFDAKTPISEIISSIGKYGAVVVNRSAKYYGIIDNRSVYRFGSARGAGRESAGKFSIAVSPITNSTSIDDVIMEFYKSRTKALPYLSGTRIVGIIKRLTLLKVLLSLQMLSGINVGEVMTSPVLTIDADSTLSQAKAAMRDKKVSRLVVMQNKRLYGIITNYDLVQDHPKGADRLPEMKSRSYGSSDAQLSGVASRNLISVDYGKSLPDAARSMIENDVSSIVVTRRGSPVGIITMFDIFGSVLSRRRIEDQKVFISGLGAENREYEITIKAALKEFMKKADRLKESHALYMTLNIKRGHGRMYEMHARLTMENQGAIYMHASDYTLEKTLNQLISKLTKTIRNRKARYISVRDVRRFKDGMDEAEGYE